MLGSRELPDEEELGRVPIHFTALETEDSHFRRFLSAENPGFGTEKEATNRILAALRKKYGAVAPFAQIEFKTLMEDSGTAPGSDALILVQGDFARMAYYLLQWSKESGKDPTAITAAEAKNIYESMMLNDPDSEGTIAITNRVIDRKLKARKV